VCARARLLKLVRAPLCGDFHKCFTNVCAAFFVLARAPFDEAYPPLSRLPLLLSSSFQTTLFEKILALPPPPVGAPSDSKQLLIANIDYDEFKGKMGIGRLTAGKRRARRRSKASRRSAIKDKTRKR
jgi:hypothetical protein